jgi:hypothetical protein
VRISTIALDTLLELVRGQVFQELGEDGLSGIHPSFSAIHAPCAYAVLALASAPGNSNRKTRVIYYRAYYVMVTADRPNLAGHQWDFFLIASSAVAWLATTATGTPRNFPVGSSTLPWPLLS